MQTHDLVSRIWEGDDEVIGPYTEYLPSRSTEAWDGSVSGFSARGCAPAATGTMSGCGCAATIGGVAPYVSDREIAKRRTAGRCAREPGGNGNGEEARPEMEHTISPIYL